MEGNPALSSEERSELESQFFQMETKYLRQLRTLKWESYKAVDRPLHTGPGPLFMASPDSASTGSGPCSKRYKTVKVLGKGSFGVVKLVKERRRDEPRDQPSRVLAMKVIKKTEMIRSCQEGHLRAERDFLIASSDSDW